MEKQYRLRYQGKWMKVIRMTGTYIYELYDDAEKITPVRFTKIQALKGLVCDDNDLEFDKVEIVET